MMFVALTPVLEHNWVFLHHNPLIDAYAFATLEYYSPHIKPRLMTAPLILYIYRGLPPPCMCTMHLTLLVVVCFPVL